MKYIARIHEKGLAIITWCLDEDYPQEDNEGGVSYMINLDIYNAEGDLIFEDCVGGVEILSHPGTQRFTKEIVDSYEYYFTTPTKTKIYAGESK
jgi:hypothetical protein